MPNPTADYPTAVHTNSDVSGNAALTLGGTTPSHIDLEGKQEEEITAVQTKVGTGSSTPSATNKVLYGSGAGASTWGTLSAAGIQAVLSEGAFADGDKTKLDYITVTQAVDLDTIETRVNGLDAAVVLQGSWDASAGTFPGSGSAQAGDSYIISVGGTVDSVVFNVGDRIVAITDNASTSVYASNWLKLDYTDAVSSVAGKTGAVTLDDADIGAAASATNYTPATSTVDGHLSGIDTALASAGGGVSTYTKLVASTGGDATTLGGLTISDDDVIYIKDSTTETGSVTITANRVTIFANNPNTVINMGANTLSFTTGSNSRLSNVGVTISTGNVTSSQIGFDAEGCIFNKTGVTASGNSWTFSGSRSLITKNKFLDTNTSAQTGDVLIMSGANSRIRGNYFNYYLDSVNTMSLSGAEQIISDNEWEITGSASSSERILQLAGFRSSFNNNVINCSAQTGIAVILQAGNMRVNNNLFRFTNATIDSGIQMADSEIIFNGNTLLFVGVSASDRAVYVNGNDNIVTNNYLEGGGTGGSDDGIEVAGNYNDVSDNRIKNFANGLQVASGTDNVTIGNVITLNGTPLADTGTTTLKDTGDESGAYNMT